MIETRENEKNVRGNLTGEVNAMTIDPEYMGHIMNVLTDMYEDRIKALVREYSTNARDAMVEAKRGDHPIEITLPGSLSPFFTVKDTGIGLDADDIRDIYSRYGASTKRATNDQVGMLGIGCKSALAYADQFTLVGIKNGVRTQVAISRNAKGGGDMTIIDSSPTDEPNGVEIVIPVKSGDASEFETKANEFFSYWEPGTVLVNGVAPVPFTENAIPIRGHDIWVVKGQQRRFSSMMDDIVVMGNVPYPTDKISTGLSWEYKIVARVPIGSVNFPPNRESLREGDPTTEATLEKLGRAYKENAKNAVQAFIDKATTKVEAMKARESWAGVLGSHDDGSYKWRGETLPHDIYVSGAASCGIHGLHAHNKKQVWEKNCPKCVEAEPSFYLCDTYKRNWTDFIQCRNYTLANLDVKVQNDHVASYNRAGSFVIVTGYDRGDKPTATVKKKLIQYLDDNAIEALNALIFRELHPRNEAALGWITPIKRIKWEDIWATKLPRSVAQQGNNGRIRGTYPVAYPPAKDYVPPEWYHSRGESGMLRGVKMKDVPADELPKNPVYTNSSKEAARAMALRCNEPVVYLTAPRKEKFLREQTGAREAHAVATARLDKWMKTLSDDERVILRAMWYYHRGANPFAGWAPLEAYTISDPDVSRLIRLGKVNVMDKYMKLSDMGGGRDQVPEPTTTFADPRKKYPLLDSEIDKGYAEHAAIYINAAYAAQQKGV